MHLWSNGKKPVASGRWQMHNPGMFTIYSRRFLTFPLLATCVAGCILAGCKKDDTRDEWFKESPAPATENTTTTTESASTSSSEQAHVPAGGTKQAVTLKSVTVNGADAVTSAVCGRNNNKDYVFFCFGKVPMEIDAPFKATKVSFDVENMEPAKVAMNVVFSIKTPGEPRESNLAMVKVTGKQTFTYDLKPTKPGKYKLGLGYYSTDPKNMGRPELALHSIMLSAD
jgi:hypothetical protein